MRCSAWPTGPVDRSTASRQRPSNIESPRRPRPGEGPAVYARVYHPVPERRRSQSGRRPARLPDAASARYGGGLPPARPTSTPSRAAHERELRAGEHHRPSPTSTASRPQVPASSWSHRPPPHGRAPAGSTSATFGHRLRPRFTVGTAPRRGSPIPARSTGGPLAGIAWAAATRSRRRRRPAGGPPSRSRRSETDFHIALLQAHLRSSAPTPS